MLTFSTIKEKTFALGVLPVIKIDEAQNAVPLAGALIKGGLPAAEVTFRTDAAAESIYRMRNAYPEMLICAGTVLTPKQADEAVDAGASFIVSPGLNENVVSHCLEKNVPVIPGCATPSDIERAIGLGLDTVKFFPAEANGGLAAVKAVSAPYPQMKFMPTGGINTSNLSQYLQFGKVLCCGGSFMVPGDAVLSGDFERIESLARDAVKIVHGLTLKSIPGVLDQSPLSALLPVKGSLPVIKVNNLARFKGYLSMLGIDSVCAESNLKAVICGLEIIFTE